MDSSVTPIDGSGPSALQVRAAANRALAAANTLESPGPNPRVGCVIWEGASIGDGGATVFTHSFVSGTHRGAGSPHAEVAALAAARKRGMDLRGASVVVTLEPCARTGRTPPCAEALIAAGVARVFYLAADPTAFGGGAGVLRAAGIEVTGPEELAPVLSDELHLARRLLRPWVKSHQTQRPYVSAKLATSLDGRIAASDGSSRWITGIESRRHAHRTRARVDGVIVGTQTALTDDPELTARTPAGELAPHQPRRIVLGRREIPPDAKLRGPGGALVELRTRSIPAALDELFRQGLRHVVLEGGARVLAAFLRANAVDELQHYQAPVLLGAGKSAVENFGVETIAQAARWHRHHLLELSADFLQILTPSETELASAVPGTWHPNLDSLTG